MYTQSVYLKIKLKSLAAEARIIRREEQKNEYFRHGLRDHRKGIVRSVARDTQIAYGFLRGKDYKQIENNPKTKPNWDSVKKMIEKYGVNRNDYSFDEYNNLKRIQMKQFEEWKK